MEMMEQFYISTDLGSVHYDLGCKQYYKFIIYLTQQFWKFYSSFYAAVSMYWDFICSIG